MIPRYSNPEMTNIWEPNYRYNIWLDIEILACEKQEMLGEIPKGITKNIREKASFDIGRIDEIEKETKHDVIAFLTSVAEHVGDSAKYIHSGMTSSDVIDTSFSIQLRMASNIIIKDLENVLKTLRKRAYESKNILCIGRSHGIHAEPTTFGLKLAYAYAEIKRSLVKMKLAKKEISVCKISGPVGNYSSISPEVEKHVAKKLNLKVEDISTQIIPRDRHAYYFTVLSIISSSIERISTEIRHLQRTEVKEAEEFFSSGQKGSSAMPHKRNPVLSENLTGLSRYVRSLSIPALENISLWHERDISHSSVERLIAPDATVTLDFALKRLNSLLSNLVIYPKKMNENINQMAGLHFSQKVLLFLISKGIDREEAYVLVQDNAMKTWKQIDRKKNKKSFFYFLSNDKRITRLTNKKDLKKVFNNQDYTKYVDFIFTRVFK